MTKSTYHPDYSGVIPASESKIFDSIFQIYINNLYRRRFDQVYVYSEYIPGSLDTTVYFLNHYSWWDALTPYLLNKRLFKQNMRAMMVEHQLRKFPFFRKIGVFSVDKEHPRKSMNALRYAADSMFRDKASLYIYPQGKIEDEHIKAFRFESGLIWLYQHLPDVHFVPIATSMNTRFSDKPRLYIRVGRRITLHQTTKDEIKLELEKSLDILRKEVQHVAEQEFPLWNRLL